MKPVGIRSLAVSFPSVVRTNDYWREKYPELVANAEANSLAKVFTALKDDIWGEEMKPYLSDPFRGVTVRRVLGTGESSLTLEYRAAIDAIEAAQLSVNDIDLMLVTSLFPQEIQPGNAAILAGQLGLQGPAWNVESTCSSATVSLQTAWALVQAEQYRNVLVVISTTYSRFARETDTLSWFLGDGAGAFVVSKLKENQGIISTKIVNTAETCGTFYTELALDEEDKPIVVMLGSPKASKMFHDTTVKLIRTCCQEAVAAAGLTLEQIDFFAFNTPTAWYANVCTRALGVDPSRTINLSSEYANIGPVLPITNLYHATAAGKIHENDLVLVYTIGSVSNAGATVMRWGDVALGPMPVSSERLIKFPVTAGI
ncbi:MAG: 3-oxoacyl-ACP synthase III family protein [Oscillatoria princeps RMCB-10]|jgi:3-oxoacyl-[acyl-carrier-protein] synthase-3|nr:3-oxoacyl-ACP synthase III family protein [Oscillatoria princeps RMCB-10]